MGKNDHGPRGKQKSKRTPQSIPDSEHVVFTNTNDQSKRNPGKKVAGQDGAPARSKSPSTLGETQSKRPDARTVIGGNASWSGKLPVNLLSEHCQKQRWEKPEYSMHKSGNGFESSVTLKFKNPKTQEITTLPPFKLPPSHRQLGIQPTALEARHSAATYALFRVSSMKNIQMALPPTYRDLWKGPLTELKRQDINKGNSWQYEADPFAAYQSHSAAKAEAVKRAEASKNAAGGSESSFHSLSTPFNRLAKAWERAPSTEMGPKLRGEVEDLVRNQAVWNIYGIRISEKQKVSILETDSQLGFRRSHVEEAINFCQDDKEVLEWLLTYVPEDDLPRWCLPEGYVGGISFASGDIVKDSMLKRLSEAGYSLEMCREAYQHAAGDFRTAANILQASLLHQSLHNVSLGPIHSFSSEWRDEMMALEAIFGDRFSSQGPENCVIEVDTEATVTRVHFKFWLPCRAYPECPPLLAIVSKNLPSYVRLSATRKAILFAQENLLGSAMIFDIVEWLENNLPKISENPGPLRDVAPKSVFKAPDKTHPPNNHRQYTRLTPLRGLGHPGDVQSRQLKAGWEQRQTSPQQQKMLIARKSLPAWPIQHGVIEEISKHQVTIISGATGSGKSTQCVQFVLDEMIRTDRGSAVNILCTQPRRISALGLAERVSAERCSNVGQEVGYIIRGDSKISSTTTRITFMTTGVLLRRLQSSGAESNSLSDVSHVFVDEVHERSLDTDILLARLREVLKSRPTLKVVMMSATLDSQTFVDYFGGHNRVGQVEIAGRTFPITDFYLDDVLNITGYNGTILSKHGNDEDEDHITDLSKDFGSLNIGRRIQSLGMGINYELIAFLLQHIDSELGKEQGSILIFLPGVAEIERCLNALKQLRNVNAIPLHASLTAAEQRRVFDRPAHGLRKVVVATNVAETSITIDDAIAVIDSGRVKETSYNPESSLVRLEEVWCSQAACQQRRGRAGRVRPGTCYKLFTRKVESEMAPRPEPEIRRIPLEQLCLSVKAADSSSSRDLSAFLRQTLTPPEDAAVDKAIALLHRIGALESSHLTSLGRYLSLIPVDLRLAKLMVLGSLFSVLEPCITITAILSERSPFVSPRDKRDEADAARKTFSKSPADGDLILALNAFDEWSTRLRDSGFPAARSWANASFLSVPALQIITTTRMQLLQSLIDAGIIPPSYKHQNPPQQSYSSTLLRALIAGSLSPQHASIAFPSQKFASSVSGSVALDAEARTIKYFTPDPPITINDNNITATSSSSTTTTTTTTTNSTRVFIHPSSTLFTSTPSSYPSGTHFLSYFSRLHTSKPFIRDCTPFNTYGMLLFGGSGVEVDPQGPGISVDGGIWRVRGWPRIGVLVRGLRRGLEGVLRGRLERMERGEKVGGVEGEDEEEEERREKEEEERLLRVVARLVEFNGLDR